MQNAFQKPEIILAYTAHAGSRFGEERGADERGEIRFGVATVSVSACDGGGGSSSTATRRNTALLQKHAFRRSVCPGLCRCVCVYSCAQKTRRWLIISSCHSAGELLTVYLHAAVTVPIQGCKSGFKSCWHTVLCLGGRGVRCSFCMDLMHRYLLHAHLNVGMCVSVCVCVLFNSWGCVNKGWTTQMICKGGLCFFLC